MIIKRLRILKKVGYRMTIKEIIDKLNEKEVFLIKDLCSLRRRVLKEYGFSNDEINDIIITLQLVGLDLNKKKSKKNVHNK